MEIKKVLTVVAWIVAAIIVLKVVSEVLSIVFASGWLILGALAIWFFFLKDRSNN